MRDEKDNATLGDLLPAKRGRPCLDLDNGPMTDAERARRYREIRKANLSQVRHFAGRDCGWISVQTDLDLLDAIRKDVSLVNTISARGQGKRGTAPARKRIASLVAELASRYPV